MSGKDFLSERMVFGLILILGYFTLIGITMAVTVAHPNDNSALNAALDIAKDGLLSIGPLLGVIVNAIWKADRVDKQNADTVNTLATAVTTAMALPSAEEVKVP